MEGRRRVSSVCTTIVLFSNQNSTLDSASAGCPLLTRHRTHNTALLPAGPGISIRRGFDDACCGGGGGHDDSTKRKTHTRTRSSTAVRVEY